MGNKWIKGKFSWWITGYIVMYMPYTHTRNFSNNLSNGCIYSRWHQVGHPNHDIRHQSDGKYKSTNTYKYLLYRHREWSPPKGFARVPSVQSNLNKQSPSPSDTISMQLNNLIWNWTISCANLWCSSYLLRCMLPIRPFQR